MNFITSLEKRINKIYKKLVSSNTMLEETHRYLKAMGTRPGIICGSCKVHKTILMAVQFLDQFLPALQTPTYKLEKFLMSIKV